VLGGPGLIVALSPLLDGSLRLLEAREPVLVRALLAELAAEALDVAVLHGLLRLDEVQPHASAAGPLVERSTRGLRPAVDDDRVGKPSLLGDAIEMPAGGLSGIERDTSKPGLSRL
jgi:hypothetical protein